jgi:hypothetical protein
VADVSRIIGRLPPEQGVCPPEPLETAGPRGVRSVRTVSARTADPGLPRAACKCPVISSRAGDGAEASYQSRRLHVARRG